MIIGIPNRSDNMLKISTEQRTEGTISKPFQFERQSVGLCFLRQCFLYRWGFFLIKADGVAVVKFLRKTTGRFDIFKWPATVEIAEVNAKFV